MKKITIEEMKNIKHLEFSFPETNGVYLLVGANGAGKTTLLVCMDRLCNSLAFVHGRKQINLKIPLYSMMLIIHQLGLEKKWQDGHRLLKQVVKNY